MKVEIIRPTIVRIGDQAGHADKGLIVEVDRDQGLALVVAGKAIVCPVEETAENDQVKKQTRSRKK